MDVEEEAGNDSFYLFVMENYVFLWSLGELLQDEFLQHNLYSFYPNYLFFGRPCVAHYCQTNGAQWCVHLAVSSSAIHPE